jgi:hypothetical protein
MPRAQPANKFASDCSKVFHVEHFASGTIMFHVEHFCGKLAFVRL